MGITKKIGFQDNINEIAEIFKALGHPARLQILKILLAKKACTCGTIVDELPLAQSTVSKHLLELKKVNLVSLQTQGKKTIYSLIDENLNFTKEFLTNHINENKKDLLEVNLIKSTGLSKIKRHIRRANPSLKNHNYSFEHLTLKKEDK